MGSARRGSNPLAVEHRAGCCAISHRTQRRLRSRNDEHQTGVTFETNCQPHVDEIHTDYKIKWITTEQTSNDYTTNNDNRIPFCLRSWVVGEQNHSSRGHGPTPITIRHRRSKLQRQTSMHSIATRIAIDALDTFHQCLLPT